MLGNNINNRVVVEYYCINRVPNILCGATCIDTPKPQSSGPSEAHHAGVERPVLKYSVKRGPYLGLCSDF